LLPGSRPLFVWQAALVSTCCFLEFLFSQFCFIFPPQQVFGKCFFWSGPDPAVFSVNLPFSGTNPPLSYRFGEDGLVWSLYLLHSTPFVPDRRDPFLFFFKKSALDGVVPFFSGPLSRTKGSFFLLLRPGHVWLPLPPWYDVAWAIGPVASVSNGTFPQCVPRTKIFFFFAFPVERAVGDPVALVLPTISFFFRWERKVVCVVFHRVPPHFRVTNPFSSGLFWLQPSPDDFCRFDSLEPMMIFFIGIVFAPLWYPSDLASPLTPSIMGPFLIFFSQRYF